MQTWNRAMVAVIVGVALTQAASVRGQVETPGPDQKPTQGTISGAIVPQVAAPVVPPVSPPTWTFDAGIGMVLFQVKASSAPAFEAAVVKIKAALVASKDPVRKRQAQSWQVLKSTEPVSGDDPIIYIFFMPVVVVDSDYDPLKILTEQFPADAQQFYDTMSIASLAINRLGLKKIVDMAGQ
jgi:hypothetical protein